MKTYKAKEPTRYVVRIFGIPYNQELDKDVLEYIMEVADDESSYDSYVRYAGNSHLTPYTLNKTLSERGRFELHTEISEGHLIEVKV